jgi:hypothetical protein
MPITVSGTSITFNDSTTQTTAFTGGGGIQTAVQSFTGPGAFTTPANTTRVYLVAVGGNGGGGGGGPSGTGGSGGFGAVGIGYYPVSASTPYPVTVGGAGNGGGGGGFGGAGNAGGSTSFGNLLTCNGGGGGNGGTPNVGGNTGATGNAPLSQASAAGSGSSDGGPIAVGVALLNASRAGSPGNADPGQPGGTGNAGRLLVYY